MKKRISVLMVGLGLGLSLTAGCIGGMAVTGSVRDFNLRVAQGKWPREAVFLVLYIIPVYPIAGMIDLVVVNSIEFHTGTNPVSGKRRIARVGETYRVAGPDGTVSRSELRADGSIDFAITSPDGITRQFNIGEREDRLVARDLDGSELASVGLDVEEH